MCKTIKNNLVFLLFFVALFFVFGGRVYLFSVPTAFGYGGGGGSGRAYVEPYASLGTPNGGESLVVGNHYAIFWTAGGTSIGGIDLKLSTNGGVSYPYNIASGVENNGYYNWLVPNLPTGHAMVKMLVLGTNISDTSDSDFTIIDVTTPAEEEEQPAEITEEQKKEETTQPQQPEVEEEITPEEVPALKTPVAPEEIQEREAAAPIVDSTVVNDYVSSFATTNNPTINIDKGLTAPVTEPKVKCESGSLIKGSWTTVYYCGKNNRRYVFVNELSYYSWYDDFNNLKIVSDGELMSIPIGGNVTYKPGVRLLKVRSDAKVYAVARGGVLRWIKNESAARAIYGNGWNQIIDDIPESFFTNYRLGEPITETNGE